MTKTHSAFRAQQRGTDETRDNGDREEMRDNEIAREIHNKAVFRRDGQMRTAYVVRRVEYMTNRLHYFWRTRLSMNWQLIKPSRRHDILRSISSPIQS